jgi:hypothetical protein
MRRINHHAYGCGGRNSAIAQISQPWFEWFQGWLLLQTPRKPFWSRQDVLEFFSGKVLGSHSNWKSRSKHANKSVAGTNRNWMSDLQAWMSTDSVLLYCVLPLNDVVGEMPLKSQRYVSASNPIESEKNVLSMPRQSWWRTVIESFLRAEILAALSTDQVMRWFSEVLNAQKFSVSAARANATPGN